MKKEEPILVAIHCLVYNHEPYLRDCFEGFVMQKTNFRFVAIVHEDCSTDNSAAIIREYEAKYPDIFRPIYETENQWHKKDGSIERIMTKAIATIGAKYVAMCEGDDFWTDEYKLQKQVDYMEAHPKCSCCAHNSLRYNTETRETELFNRKLLSKQDYSLRSFILRDWFTPTQTLLIRWNEFHYFDDMPEFLHGDYSLLVNILLNKGTYLHYDNDIMSAYRMGGYCHLHFGDIEFYKDHVELLKYYKQKSNHTCDEEFDAEMRLQEQRCNAYINYELAIEKSNNKLFHFCFRIYKFFARIFNKYVNCIKVEKRYEYKEIPNLEPIA